jgi:hypothetical protein
MRTAPLKLYLSEDFQQAACAFPKSARPSRGVEPTSRLTKNEFRVTVPYRHSRESRNLEAAGPQRVSLELRFRGGDDSQ